MCCVTRPALAAKVAMQAGMRELAPRPAGPHPDPAHWRQVRAAALARDRGCRLCGDDRELEVHHRSYQRWGREEPADLTVLCRGCHDLVTGAMMRLRDARRRPPPDGRVVVPIERVAPCAGAAAALPDPARAWRAVERAEPGPGPVGVPPPPGRARR
jgi:hypothetical protein